MYSQFRISEPPPNETDSNIFLKDDSPPDLQLQFAFANGLNQDALNLPSRPPFHNTTLMFCSILSFIIVTYVTGYLKLSYIGWILLVAVISHHLRDSLHRGLWLWPIHLKPMKRFPCLLLTYCFPLLVGILIHYLYKPRSLTVKYDFIV